MAPRLAASQLEFIHDMISSGLLSTSQMSEAAGCSKRSIIDICSKLRLFGNVRAPPNRGGRPQIITSTMLDALRELLQERPDLYLDEMVDFLWEEFHVVVSAFTISRALRSSGWSKKVTRQVAKERNADLRDWRRHNLLEFCSYHLVYVDESGYDRRSGHRQTCSSPLGLTPVQISQFQSGQRYQILPALPVLNYKTSAMPPQNLVLH